MTANEPILDRDFAINQLGGNEELLVKMFGKFLAQYADDAAKVKEYIDAKDYLEAKRTIHGIKGVSGNLGLKALQQACREAEEILREMDDSEPNELLAQRISTFESALKSTLIELENYQSTPKEDANTSNESEPADNAECAQAKAKLNAAVDNFQFIAPEELKKLLACLEPNSIDIAQLEKAISDLDYELAKSLLDA